MTAEFPTGDGIFLQVNPICPNPGNSGKIYVLANQVDRNQ
jgi:hypothetical protein